MEPKGRNNYPLAQSPALGTLLKKLCVESSAVLLLSTNIIPALMVQSCQREDLQVTATNPEDGSGEDSADSTAINLYSATIDYYTKSRLEDTVIEKLDIFIYDSEGTRPLLSHQILTDGLAIQGSPHPTDGTAPRIPLQGHLELTFPRTSSSSADGAIVVIIANCPKALNDQALARFDSMTLLEFALADDRPEAPLLTGMAYIPDNTQDASTSASEPARYQIELTPLLSRVIISAVTNGLSGYELLEDPQALLHDLTPSAKILQHEEFRPVEVIESSAPQSLPCDIGFYTQHPDLSLFCYPNDTPETTLGSPRTSLEFTCRIKGLECSFPITLPPINRNSITRVEITINGPTDYTTDIY